MSDEIPTWLTVAQNGSIGEARTRAFLLDRFWVLERSVDIDGADFIIQRRLTRQNLLDRDSPRLGVVQAKFFEAAGTTQYVHQEYVRDAEGKPRSEFFLLCHTGDEQDPRVFLITAEEIVAGFKLVTNGVQENKYRIAGGQLFKDTQFAVLNRKRALDRIEHALQLADFTKNRRFLSWLLPSARLDAAAIDPIYREPVESWWGDIPKGFLDLKQTAKRATFKLEEIHEKLNGIIESTDPEEAFELVKEIAYECRTGYGWHVSLPNNLSDGDFEAAVREHKQRVIALKSRGLLEAFSAFNEIIKKEFGQFLGPLMPFARDKAHVVRIVYDPNTLLNVVVHSEVQDAQKYVAAATTDPRRPPHDGVLEATPGLVRYWWMPGNYVLDDKVASESWETYIRTKYWSPYRDITEALYATHFGNPE